MNDADQLLLEMIADPRARQMLELLNEPLTASELADACSMALSTTYRKLDKLETAGLVETETRISGNGFHPTAYQRAFDQLKVDLGGEGPTIRPASQRPAE